MEGTANDINQFQSIFHEVDDYPPERWAYDALCAINGMLDVCELTQQETLDLMRVRDICQEISND